MKPTLRSREIPTLPKLAWVASLDMNHGTLEVTHGSGVECRADWVVEGVWDGEFSEGAFHRSENFFGSGIRVERDNVYFVPSSALVDRLLYCISGDCLLISNSLVLLLAFTGATLDKNHDYRIESNAICKGIRKYRRELPVLHREISHFCQLYHDTMLVADGCISFRSRSQKRRISSFEDYSALVRSVLRAISRNSQDPSRKHKLSAFTTLSSGYDSVAVSCLVRECGVTTCFTSVPRSKWRPSYWLFGNTGLDDGRPIADALHLSAMPLRALRPSDEASVDSELYFYAATCASFELVFHSMSTYIQRNCAAALVFTGYHGDKVWDVNVADDFQGDDMRRGDISGLTLSEVRLKSGFINVGVPFILARSIKDLVEISRSDAMAPWRLHNSYDRPIPRRIAETAGVGRWLFGMKKNAAWRSRGYPVNRQFRREFFRFVREAYRLRPALVLLAEKANRAIFICEASARWLCDRLTSARNAGQKPRTGERAPATSSIHPRKFWKDMHLNRQLFIWSANRLSADTAEMLRQQTPVGH